MENKPRFARKLLGAFFCLAMLLALAPTMAFAAEDKTCTASSCAGAYDANGFCATCGGYEEPSLEGEYYQIGNAGQLHWFSQKAATDRGVNAVLTADIDLNPGYVFSYVADNENGGVTVTKDGSTVTEGWRNWDPIGAVGSMVGFSGIFDGCGYTISGMYCIEESSYESDRAYLGLFGFIDGGTVKNVGVVNGYISGNNNLGGIAGHVASGAISKCWNETAIESTAANGGSDFGGIAGSSYGVITGCWNGGTIHTRGHSLGGIVGRQGSGIGSKLDSCYNLGAVTPKNNETNYGPIAAVDDGGRVSNCYYLESTETDGLSGTTAASAADFASGKVTYLLNGGVTDGTQVWYQTCGTGYPAYSGKTVYRGSSKCYLDDENAQYTNDPAKIASHEYNQSGFCSNLRDDGTTPCGDYQPCVKNADGAYEIGNAGQLYWFARQVNDAGETSANAVLTADVTVNKDVSVAEGRRAWTPIGNYWVTAKKYTGSFDGQGHAIKGLYCDQGARNNAALFGECENATLQNVTVANSVFYADQLAAAIVGDAYASRVANCHSVSNEIVVKEYTAAGVVGGCTNGTIERCSNTSSVAHVGKEAVENGFRSGGIVGWAEGATISDCWNSGKISARRMAAGGIVGGKSGSLTIKNCHNVGEVTLLGEATASGAYGPILGMQYSEEEDDEVVWGSLVVENCFYLEPEVAYPESTKRDGSTEKSAAAFASGEVTWLLNGEKSENAVWKQMLGSDAYPNFTGETVYFRNGEYSNNAFIDDAVITVVDADIVYDGTQKTPAVQVVLGGLTLTEGTDYVVSYSNNVDACDDIADADAPTVTITGQGKYTGSASKRFVIGRATLVDVSVKQSGKLFYDGGKALTPAVTANATTADGSRPLFLYSADGESYGAMPTFVEAGSYTVYYCAYTADNNHVDFYDSFSVTVDKAENSWTTEPSIAGWSYGEEANAPVAIAQFGEVKVTYAGTANDKTSWSSVTAPTKAGDYTAIFTVEEAKNYGSLSAQVNFTIARANYDMSAAKWDYASPFQYDGKEHEVEVVGLPAGVTVESYENNAATAVGDYYAEANLAYNADNYNAPTINVLGWTICNDWTPTEYTVSAPNGNGWLNNDFAITAAEGYKVSLVNAADGDWKDALTYSEETSNDSVTFYLKNTETGAISLAKTVTYKLDKTAPVGEVRFDEMSGWSGFIDNITFDLFFKEEVSVKVENGDNLSGVASVEYLESEETLSLDVLKSMRATWAPMPAEGAGIPIQDEKRFICYVRITDNAGNVSYLSTNGAEYDITAPVISGVEDGKTYYTTQKAVVVDRNIEGVTLNGNPVDASVTLEGDKNATYVIEVTDKAGNVTAATITMKSIEEIDSTIEGITVDDVTSDDRDEIQGVIDEIDELLSDENASDEEKSALKRVKAEAEDLIEKIDEAADAASTENTDKVEDVTDSNVKLDDKDDLEKAKADLEKALEDNAGNYTEDERKALEDEILRIDEVLKVIEEVEKVEALIDALPDAISEGDEAAVKAAEDAYNALSDHGKSLVSKDAKEALEKAAKALEKAEQADDDAIAATGDDSPVVILALIALFSSGVILLASRRMRRAASGRS